MSKNYQIGGNVMMNGVKVPLILNGWKYLDWRRVKGTKAPLLTSPYGEGHFVLGGSEEEEQVVLDYAELPDGTFVVDMAAPPAMGFHCEDDYYVHDRDDLLAAVHYKLTKIVDRLIELGIKHDADRHGADAWYFQRAIGKEAKVPAYVGMGDRELRFGR